MEVLKEKFFLLSHVAKEKKYAQEYLGLLARRGDIGSIRIGKRWYTTWDWFEEFLENSEKKKAESVSGMTEADASEVEVEKVVSNTSDEQTVKISLPIAPPVREKVFVAQPAAVRPAEEIFSIRVKTPFMANAVRKEDVKVGVIGDIKIRTVAPKIPPRKFSIEERNRNAVPYREVKMKKSDGVFSPGFSASENARMAFFPRFAFAAGFAIMIFLAAASGYFIYSGGMFSKGEIAGASSEKSNEFSNIQSGGEYLLTGAGEKMKESLSISRVVMEVARENQRSNSDSQ